MPKLFFRAERVKENTGPGGAEHIRALSSDVRSKAQSRITHKAELHGGSIEDLLAHLENSRGVYVDGGQVIQSFLRLGLIDEMTITHIPVLLGAGLPLFGPLPQDMWWEHQHTRTFAGSGLVQSVYRRATLNP